MAVLRLYLILLCVLAFTMPAGAGDDARPHGVPKQAITVRQAQDALRAATAAWDHQIDELRDKRFAAITALHDGRCKEALDYFQIDDGKKISTRWILLRAHLHWRGLCFKQDSAEAVRVLEYAIDDDPGFADAMALLGALYWRGDGVPRNQNKARALFRSAIVNKGPSLLANETGSSISHGEPAEARYWGLSENELDRAFTEGVVGPWHLPGPLTQQLAWFDSVKSDGGKVMAVAFALRNGSDGYPKHPVLAFNWLRAASQYMEYGPAHFPYAQWLRDDELFALRVAAGYTRPEYRNSDYGSSNLALLEAAKFRDVRAEREILRLLKAGPDFTQKNWALYYWTLRLKAHGGDISEDEVETARADVAPNERGHIEDWEKDQARWGLSSTPPYTHLPKIP